MVQIYTGEHDPVHGASRETPIVSVKEIFARAGGVVVAGRRGDEEVEEKITISEAIARARALSDMCKASRTAVPPDERKKMLDMVDKLIVAINQAKEQRDGFGYKSTAVSMATVGRGGENPHKPLIIDGKEVTGGVTEPNTLDPKKQVIE